MSKFEFDGVALSDSRGNLNPMGRIWTHLAYLSVLNLVLDNSTFQWSYEAASLRAGCSVDQASQLLEAAAEYRIVNRTKTRRGDRTPWQYTEGDRAWDLYVDAVREGLMTPVINERQYEAARGLAIRTGFILGPDKEVLGQLAARATGNLVWTTTREVAEMVKESGETIHQTTALRAMKRLEEKHLLKVVTPGKGRGRSEVWVALTEEDRDAAAEEALQHNDSEVQSNDAEVHR